MPAPSLLDMTRRRLQRSIDLVVDVGDIPFHVLEPVLKKIENPKQLREIEANSPHIAEDTGPLWFNFIKRDIQNWEKKPHKPRNPAMWCKVYYKLSREQEEEFAAQQKALKAALAKTEQERKKNTSKLLDRAIDPVKHRRIHLSSGPSVTRDPRNYTYMPGEQKKRLTGRGIIAKIQHQAQASVSARRSNSLMNVPTHLLASRNRSLSAAETVIAWTFSDRRR
ncbi:RNA polymerase II transcription factor SIII subunit A [Macrophomina phaseolina MS6]|uniref:RNA polymerase II transcription factor SIII subunit A n=1 Tax=Macrophomina phaseolina (strain MS6) TaxID=1126212 RepID=K2RSI0_MACPH|nr:RNA polymerase II transcription factor SIII subunit A [Macrophomina phaseolina MS6]